MKTRRKTFLRAWSSLLIVGLMLTTAPQAARAAVGVNGPILLDGMTIGLQTVNGRLTYHPQVNVSSAGVVYTVDETATLTGMNYDRGRDIYLYFKTQRGASPDMVPVVYEPAITNPSCCTADDGDWTAQSGGYKLSTYITYQYDGTSDPTYYLYKFRFYQGAPGAYNASDFTDYTLRFKRYPQVTKPTYAATLYAGVNSVLSPWAFRQLGSSDFAAVAGQDYREYVAASGITYPFTIRVRCVNYYKNTPYLDGVRFPPDQQAKGVDVEYTLTAQKPYVELYFVPGDIDSEEIHWVPGRWRITVQGTTASSPIKVTGGKISPIVDTVYTGSQLRPPVSVSVGGNTLRPGTDYTLGYGANKNIGKGTVTVTGKGLYTGNLSASFKIVPKPVAVTKLAPGAKKLKATWAKAPAAQKITGYQIQYRVSGTAGWKAKTVSAKTLSFTAKSLKKGKVYEVQVRAYKTVGGAKYYGAWGAAKASSKIK